MRGDDGVLGDDDCRVDDGASEHPYNRAMGEPSEVLGPQQAPTQGSRRGGLGVLQARPRGSHSHCASPLSAWRPCAHLDPTLEAASRCNDVCMREELVSFCHATRR